MSSSTSSSNPFRLVDSRTADDVRVEAARAVLADAEYYGLLATHYLDVLETIEAMLLNEESSLRSAPTPAETIKAADRVRRVRAVVLLMNAALALALLDAPRVVDTVPDANAVLDAMRRAPEPIPLPDPPLARLRLASVAELATRSRELLRGPMRPCRFENGRSFLSCVTIDGAHLASDFGHGSAFMRRFGCVHDHVSWFVWDLPVQIDVVIGDYAAAEVPGGDAHEALSLAECVLGALRAPYEELDDDDAELEELAADETSSGDGTDESEGENENERA